MDNEERSRALLELSKIFFDKEKLELAESHLENGENAIVEKNILITVDYLYEEGFISKEQAEKAYLVLDLSISQSELIRLNMSLCSFSFREKVPLRSLLH